MNIVCSAPRFLKWSIGMVVVMSDILHQIVLKIEMVNNLFIKAIESIGIAALFLIMFITLFDVIGAKMFLAPIFGSLDIVMLIQVVAISFTTAAALMAGKHVHVELFLPYLPKSLRSGVIATVHILGVTLFVLISLNLFRYGYRLQETGEVSPTAHIAIYPFAYGAAVAFIPICIELLLRTVRVLFRIDAGQT